VESAGTGLIEEIPGLIEHYRPLRLKAVVAATSVKRKVQEDKRPGERSSFKVSPGGYLDISFSD